MHEIKIGEAAAMLGVSPDTLRRLADAGSIKTRRTRGGQRVVDGRSLAAYLAKRDRPTGKAASSLQSVRNRLPGIITRVVKDKVAAHVEIQAGPFHLVSLLTREAVDELSLAPGMVAVATVKATNLGLELPPPAKRAKRSA
jgi:molybdopterin-binding protein